MKGVSDYLKMSTDPTASAAATSLINSDLQQLGQATKNLADHVIKLGVSGGLITTILQWFAFFAAVYLLVLDRTNWRTNMLTSLLVPYVFLTFPNWLFGILRGDIGRWILLVGVIVRLFFPHHFRDDLLLPGSIMLLVVEHIRASGGFKNAFTKSNGISNSIAEKQNKNHEKEGTRVFTRDNNYTIEFDAFGFSVKDFLTRHILLKCDNSGDLYPVTNLSSLPSALMSLSPFTWHQCLGHPDGTRKITQRLNLHVSHISHVPKSPSLALSDPHWQNAMYDEYNALIKNGTWVLVPKPSGANIVRCLMLFRHKFHADGSLSRYKARMVANGSSQQIGIDCDESFSPVVKPTTIRTVFSLALTRHWPIHQLDVKNAFFNGDLSETVYMHQPPGFVDPRYPHHACRLQRCGTDTTYLLIYMDDIVLMDFSTTLLQKIIFSLHWEFDMTDLCALNHFVGISVTHDTTRMFLFQKRYAMELLERAHMLNSILLGLLLTISPSLICLYMHDPREPHLAALKKILRSVRGTLEFGLQLYASSESSLVAYSDADWAGCPATRRSTSGYCVFLGNNILSWSSKRQPTISRSSAEAEYRGVAIVVAETAWLRNLL
nr:ribonuclease H-like domain-containing protein [Tanacetum cinerariifolium]